MWDRLKRDDEEDIRRRLEKAKEELNLGNDEEVPEHLNPDAPQMEADDEEDLPFAIIVYRQEDSIVMTDRLYIDLAEEFGEDALIREGDIPTLGTEKLTPLHEDIQDGDGLFVVIGTKWLTLKNEEGTRRIDDPNDPIHQAIARAIELDLIIVPILVYGAVMPKADYLPEPLKALAEKRPLRLGSTDEFDINIDRDMARIREQVRTVLQGMGPTIL